MLDAMTRRGFFAALAALVAAPIAALRPTWRERLLALWPKGKRAPLLDEINKAQFTKALDEAFAAGSKVKTFLFNGRPVSPHGIVLPETKPFIDASWRRFYDDIKTGGDDIENV